MINKSPDGNFYPDFSMRPPNGDIQYGLSTLAFKNGEQIEYFNSIIIRLQQGAPLGLAGDGGSGRSRWVGEGGAMPVCVLLRGQLPD